MELHTKHIISNIHKTGGFISPNSLVIPLGCCNRDHVLADNYFFVGSRSKIIVIFDAMFEFIKGAVSFFQHLFYIGRNIKPFLFYPLNSLSNTVGIPEFKGTHFKVIPPLHGVIDFNNGIGNFRNPVGSIQKTVGSHSPGKFPTFIIPFKNTIYFFF